MNKVQRWACNNFAENMVPFSLGSWVETTDYDKLEAENARLKEQVERLTNAGNDLEYLCCFVYDEGDINQNKNACRILDAWSDAKKSNL